MRAETGIVGVYGHPRAAAMVLAGLGALGHRGGSSVGLVGLGAGGAEARYGALTELRTPGQSPSASRIVLGQCHDVHDRDAADGSLWTPSLVPRAPTHGTTGTGPLAVAVAGGVLNRKLLKEELLGQGALWRGTTLAELILQLVASSAQRSAINRLVDALWRVRGAYAVLLATKDAMVAVRDPHGIQPLILGRLEGATVVASEDVALEAMGATPLRDVGAGEMVVVDHRGTVQVRPFQRRAGSPCGQEALQLMSSGSSWEGWQSDAVRQRVGAALATEHPAPAHGVVVAAEAAAHAAAAGFAHAAGLRHVVALAQIPGGPARVLGEAVVAKRVVLVTLALGHPDTLRDTVAALRLAGATSVDVRVVTPRGRRSCPYGVRSVDVSDGLTEVTFAHALGAESTAWLGTEQALRVLAGFQGVKRPCLACLGEPWPIVPSGEGGQLGLFEGDAEEVDGAADLPSREE